MRRRSAGEDYVENLLEAALEGSSISRVDRSLVQELVYGVVRWESTLDWLIGRKADVREQKPVLQIILRLGLYQILWLDRIPDHAAVNETVSLAHLAGFAPQVGFVNAVLRGYAREKDATRQMLADLKSTNPAVACSHPAWLVDRWVKRWDAAKALALMEWNNTPPKIHARINTLRTEPGALLAQWREENVEYDFRRWDWTDENSVFELKTYPPLTKIPSFQSGCFYIQDPSTLLAVRELSPRPGQSVLDFCAAPGGKTTFIAQLMGNQGRIVAQDSSSDRLDMVKQNCTRLGVTCVETALLNLHAPPPASPPQFDKVLVDAPCSNTGVMRRRVDLRWRVRLEEIQRLSQAQAALLDSAALRVKPGGTLVYSTCSLEPEENQALVARFLSTHPGFVLAHERELLPFIDGVDGAYVARLVRI